MQSWFHIPHFESKITVMKVEVPVQLATSMKSVFPEGVAYSMPNPKMI